MFDLVTIQMLKAGIAVVTLNRPERRNALSILLLETLCDQVERLASEKSNRVVIVRGHTRDARFANLNKIVAIMCQQADATIQKGDLK